MIVEAFKLVSSIFPFIKEAFLWRDGAEVGKPITQQNLIRRKIAVFVLMGSLVTNYLVVSKLYEYYDKNKHLSADQASAAAQIAVLSAKNADLIARQSHMVPSTEVVEMAQAEIEAEIHQGLLLRAGKKPEDSLAKKKQSLR